MKIEAVLEGYPDYCHIKIGSSNGNGYFYYGTIGDWRKNGNDYSDELKDHMYSRYLKSLKNSNDTIQSFCRNIIAKSENGVVPEKYISTIENYFGRISKMVNAKNNTKKWYDNFVPVSDREVVEFFDADMAIEDEDCMILIVEGNESGKFWDGNEAHGKCGVGINAAAEGALMGMEIDI